MLPVLEQNPRKLQVMLLLFVNVQFLSVPRRCCSLPPNVLLLFLSKFDDLFVSWYAVPVKKRSFRF